MQLTLAWLNDNGSLRISEQLLKERRAVAEVPEIPCVDGQDEKQMMSGLASVSAEEKDAVSDSDVDASGPD